MALRKPGYDQTNRTVGFHPFEITLLSPAMAEMGQDRKPPTSAHELPLSAATGRSPGLGRSAKFDPIRPISDAVVRVSLGQDHKPRQVERQVSA